MVIEVKKRCREDVKMQSKAIVMVFIAVAAVAVGTTLYLMMSAPSDVYELSYRFQPGESYVYDTTWSVELLGASTEFSLSQTLNVLQILDHEFSLRDSAEVELIIPGQAPQTVKLVMTYRMTDKGVRSGLEIEEVEPPEARTLMEQTRGQYESFLQSIYHYPTDPVLLGDEWSMPIDVEFLQAGASMRLVGEVTSSIVDRESVTVEAGTFDCLRLLHNITASGETVVMDQTVTVTMSGEATSWIDLQSCAQTKVNLPLGLTLKLDREELEVSTDITMELTEYRAS